MDRQTQEEEFTTRPPAFRKMEGNGGGILQHMCLSKHWRACSGMRKTGRLTRWLIWFRKPIRRSRSSAPWFRGALDSPPPREPS